MSRPLFYQSAKSPAALTPEQLERVRTALRSAAGEFVELGAEELEERILPGMVSNN